MLTYAVSVDWLQVFCTDLNQSDLSSLYNGKTSYEFSRTPHSSRHFAEIWNVVNEDGDLYAVIQRKPFSSIISADGAIVQLCNRELYKSFYISEFICFLARHGFKYKSLSRLDVCFDSNVLHNGLKYPNLIKKLMTGDYLKNNQAKVKWNFSAIADVGKPMLCNSCSFGSPTSDITTKIYNKTLEMAEVKKKPYIIERWAYNNIDVNQDVWRMEISIKSKANKVVRLSTGEIFRLNPDILEMQQAVEDVFFSYADKYFDFRINDGTKNKTRMKKVQLYPPDRQRTIIPINITEESDSNRSDRIFLKKLHSLMRELKCVDVEVEEAMWKVSSAVCIGKGLTDYRWNKILHNPRKELLSINQETDDPMKLPKFTGYESFEASNLLANELIRLLIANPTATMPCATPVASGIFAIHLQDCDRMNVVGEIHVNDHHVTIVRNNPETCQFKAVCVEHRTDVLKSRMVVNPR